jgi:ligand-binding SRPBCC domain-containing protein
VSKIHILRSTLWVPQPPAAVFPFFADAYNLQALTPPWLSFQVLTPPPIELRQGALIDYRLRVHGLPLRWRTRIVRFEPPFAFADEQLRGPYRRWHHEHTFAARDGGTELGDRVELIAPGGPLAPLLFRWLIRGDVQRIFEYRLQIMGERFGGAASGGRVWFE